VPEPLVSVVLPVYNRERWIARAVDSVLAQTYRNVELIVVDDGSTDGTRGVLERYGDALTLLAQPRGGAYVARNLALRHARGELVAFIDSDDAWLPHRLARQVPLLGRPEVGLVFGDALHVPHRRRTCFQVSPPARGRAAARFAWANFVPTITVLARRACIDEAGGFSEESALSCDYLLWFRIALRHELDYVDEIVAEYTVHPEGISYNLGRSLAARIRLFSSELRRTSNRRTRTVLKLLLWNLRLRFVLAIARGRFA
jgi:glycosyltransferase involved in cell wall biosynthesis